jgi:hypothetical protein
VLGFGYSAYKSITDGIDWTRDATKTVANAANGSYCWLKNGGYMVCDGKWFETISERLVEVVVVVTSLNIILVGYDLGFKYASGVKNGSAKTISSATEFSAALSHFPE